ncbi:MAG: GIY-YIG nuclease family protein [Planctomycetes bacterium]|nr:GIY-YIG nuclease family protein [Planctomycetota bacterium]
MAVGKTIQIFLPDGNPRSVKIAEITSRTAQAVLVPRSKLEFIASRDELKTVGIYFLIGSEDSDLKSLLYVGEAEDCLSRLRQYNLGKEFWNVAIGIVSKTQYFTKTHVKYLEWLSYTEAIEVNRFRLENANAPTKPYIPEPVESDLEDIFEAIKLLVSTLGYPIFDRMRKVTKKEALVFDTKDNSLEGTSSDEVDDILICKGKNAHAQGEYTEEGLVVFSDSKCNVEEAPTIPRWASKMRQRLFDEDILSKEGNVYVFKSDYVFSSPTAAADTVLGRSANGWTEWKYQDGKTLDEVKRKQFDSE